MTSRGRTLEVRFIGDADDAIRALRAMNRELGGTADAEQKATASGRSWNTTLGAVRGSYIAVAAAAAGAVAATAAVTAGVRSAVSAASDQVEAQSRVEAVYGSSGAAILRWSEDSATGFGLARTEALAAAGDFGNMFSQLGIGTEQAAGLSTEMVELAADFASFHNADITDVLIAQAAAFRGEYDAVQRYVPVINAAAVEQQALQMGLAESSKELTQQDKALATHALLIQGAGDATGDFARTSDNLANKQRTLNAQLADVRAEIGKSLLPVVEDIVGGVSDWIDRNDRLLKQDIPGLVEGVVQAGEDVLEIFERLRNSPVIQIEVEIVERGGELVAQLLGGPVSAGRSIKDGAGGFVGGLQSALGAAGDLITGGPRAVQSLIDDLAGLQHGRVPTGPLGRVADAVELGNARPFVFPGGESLEAEIGGAPRGGFDMRVVVPPAPGGSGSGSGRGGSGGGGRSGLSALEEEAESTSGKVRELADALMARTGMSLVDAVEQARDSLAVDAERARLATQARIDKAVLLANQEREAQEALIETTKQLTEGFGSLVARMAGSDFWQRAGQRDPIGAAARLTAEAENIARLNQSLGLDPNGDPLPGVANPGTLQPGWSAPGVQITQHITITGEPSTSKVTHDTQMMGIELAHQLDLNGAR